MATRTFTHTVLQPDGLTAMGGDMLVFLYSPSFTLEQQQLYAAPLLRKAISTLGVVTAVTLNTLETYSAIPNVQYKVVYKTNTQEWGEFWNLTTTTPMSPTHADVAVGSRFGFSLTESRHLEALILEQEQDADADALQDSIDEVQESVDDVAADLATLVSTLPTWHKQTFTGNGVLTAFTLTTPSVLPANMASIIVIDDGLVLDDAKFSVTTTTLARDTVTVTVATANTKKLVVRWFS